MNAPAAPARITVLLVDDHAVVREGYRRLLEKAGDIVVVGEAATGAEALELCAALAPQIVVLDVALPGVSGIEVLRRLRATGTSTRVLVFSMYDDTVYADRALQSGASGYVTKASAPEVLVEAVQALAHGRAYLSHDVAQKLALRATASVRDASATLSPREFEILRLLVNGTSVSDIAAAMGLNPKTVANHQSAIKQKLGAESALQLIRIGEGLLAVEKARE